jgi:hypothetical protein
VPAAQPPLAGGGDGVPAALLPALGEGEGEGGAPPGQVTRRTVAVASNRWRRAGYRGEGGRRGAW